MFYTIRWSGIVGFLMLLMIFLVSSGQSLANEHHTKHESRSQSAIHESFGEVRKITKGQIIIAHQPIPALKWPAMTMPFVMDKQGMVKDIKPGDWVRFTLSNKNDDWTVLSIVKSEKGKK